MPVEAEDPTNAVLPALPVDEYVPVSIHRPTARGDWIQPVTVFSIPARSLPREHHVTEFTNNPVFVKGEGGRLVFGGLSSTGTGGIMAGDNLVVEEGSSSYLQHVAMKLIEEKATVRRKKGVLSAKEAKAEAVKERFRDSVIPLLNIFERLLCEEVVGIDSTSCPWSLGRVEEIRLNPEDEDRPFDMIGDMLARGRGFCQSRKELKDILNSIRQAVVDGSGGVGRKGKGRNARDHADRKEEGGPNDVTPKLIELKIFGGVESAMPIAKVRRVRDKYVDAAGNVRYIFATTRETRFLTDLVFLALPKQIHAPSEFGPGVEDAVRVPDPNAVSPVSNSAAPTEKIVPAPLRINRENQRAIVMDRGSKFFGHEGMVESQMHGRCVLKIPVETIGFPLPYLELFFPEGVSREHGLSVLQKHIQQSPVQKTLNKSLGFLSQQKADKVHPFFFVRTESKLAEEIALALRADINPKPGPRGAAVADGKNRWWSLGEIAKELGVCAETVEVMLGTVLVQYGENHFQKENVGMDLIHWMKVKV